MQRRLTSWEADSYSAGQRNVMVVRTPLFLHGVHRTSSLHPILRQQNPVHYFMLSYSKTHYSVILQSTPRFLKCPLQLRLSGQFLSICFTHACSVHVNTSPPPWLQHRKLHSACVRSAGTETSQHIIFSIFWILKLAIYKQSPDSRQGVAPAWGFDAGLYTAHIYMTQLNTKFYLRVS